MGERPKTLTLELAKSTIRWFDAHPEERAAVEQFVAMMVEELRANDGKGNRPGWLEMDRTEALGEVHWHAAKLAVAAKRLDERRSYQDDEIHPDFTRTDMSDVREFAADVANCSLMALDCLGLLLPFPTQQETN